jgi:hypothetical protein
MVSSGVGGSLYSSKTPPQLSPNARFEANDFDQAIVEAAMRGCELKLCGGSGALGAPAAVYTEAGGFDRAVVWQQSARSFPAICSRPVPFALLASSR